MNSCHFGLYVNIIAKTAQNIVLSPEIIFQQSSSNYYLNAYITVTINFININYNISKFRITQQIQLINSLLLE